ncbi:hypothetical protein AVDCRST_MAG82-2107, partial [uncultured Rubrobacteraceae bacterium]
RDRRPRMGGRWRQRRTLTTLAGSAMQSGLWRWLRRGHTTWSR